jgi:hypothetical protein
MGTISMEEYRAYLLGPDGHIVDRVDLLCADENTAKQKAEDLAEDCVVELWQGARKIAVYQPRQMFR